MLIISQPKSASTSLVHTLGKLAGVESLRLDRLGKKVKSYNFLPHSDLIDFPEALLSKIINENKFYQQHVPPTKNNLGLIKKLKSKCLVTLRNPNESFDAYFRQPDLLEHLKTLKKRYGKSALSSIQSQLCKFHEIYLEEIKKNDQLLVIWYNDLVKNPKEVCEAALNFLEVDYKFPADFKLEKYRYTNGGKLTYKYYDP